MTTTAPRSRTKGTVTVVPQDVKQPQDRKPKAADAEQTEEARVQALVDGATTAEVEGGIEVTMSGFTVLVPDGARDDFELLAEIGQMDQKMARGRGPSAIAHFPGVMRALVGDDGYRTVLNELRRENGRVPVEPAVDIVLALLAIMKVTPGDEGDED